MSALSEASTPAHEPQPIDQQLQHQQPFDHNQQQQPQAADGQNRPNKRRSSPIPRIRRACTACHTGKTRCSEVLPCQSCLKRGLGATCAYPEPENNAGAAASVEAQPLSANPAGATASTSYIASTSPANQTYQQQYQMSTIPSQYTYDYNTGSSTSTFRPSKRPRALTEEEAAAITRNFSRGDFYVGSSAPVRIDPRLPVRLTLGEGDHVHFTVGEAMV